MDPAELLTRHGLPTAGLEPMAGGLVNRAWRTARHVVRVGPNADHPREARLASAARALGVATPPAVAAGSGYSIWERWPGAPPSEPGRVPTATWNALLDDLDRVHAAPLEPRPADAPSSWRGRPAWVEASQPAARWSTAERQQLERLLAAERPLAHPAFVHGDAFAANVLVDADGGYVGIVDWGCAGWSSLEHEAARLEDAALDLARERWRRDLDIELVRALRVDLLLEVAARGFATFDAVRRLLRHAVG